MSLLGSKGKPERESRKAGSSPNYFMVCYEVAVASIVTQVLDGHAESDILYSVALDPTPVLPPNPDLTHTHLDLTSK